MLVTKSYLKCWVSIAVNVEIFLLYTWIYLARPTQDDRQLLVQLIEEQRKVRQNQRALGWALLGFVAGTLVALLTVFH